MPRRSSASRNINSICEFTERSSVDAIRSSSAHKAGSTRSRNVFLSALATLGYLAELAARSLALVDPKQGADGFKRDADADHR